MLQIFDTLVTEFGQAVNAVISRTADTLYEAIFPEPIKFTIINAMEELRSFIVESANNIS